MMRHLLVDNVVLADGSRAAVVCHDGLVQEIGQPGAFIDHAFRNRLDGGGGLLMPSLCHSHIHLDKCNILDKCTLEDGSFQEALRVTGAAKSHFTEEDLLQRGRTLIRQSVKFGVTSMRAHVEVDDMVQFRCLDAGIRLSRELSSLCDVQICAFAQEPIVGHPNADLLRKACTLGGPVSAVGSAPYVEATDELALQNIDLLIAVAIEHKLHLDFHLDYNLSPARPPLIHAVLSKLHAAAWTSANPGRTVVIGHATRLALFSPADWAALRAQIGGLPVTLVALPQSDTYMLGRGATLDVVRVVETHGVAAALGVNNVGNAFTPQGTADPLALCPLGVALYQNATPAACRVLLEAVSTRSRAAIGLGGSESGLQVAKGVPADLLVLHWNESIQSAVLKPSETRTTIKCGNLVAWKRMLEWEAA